MMAVAFTLLFLTLHLAAMRNEILRRRVRTLQMMQAQPEARHDAMSLGPHASFIVAAYALVGDRGRRADRLGRCSTIAARRQRLRDLERSGVTRRSGRSATDTP